MDKLRMLSHNSKKWCFILSLQRRGASDNEVGDYCDYGDYEDVGTPVVPTRMAWLKGKMGRLDSIRSNRSISSSSTYIYGMGGRKQFHKSQLSLYDKISRKISLGRPASRKSSQSHSQVGLRIFNHVQPISRPTVTVV